MANKLPLYITSQERYGPCHSFSTINQGHYAYNSTTGKDEYYWDCWVAMEKDKEGWHSEGACNQGANYCFDNQSFCAIAAAAAGKSGPEYQTVGKIMPEFCWDLTYDTTTGKSKALSYDKDVIILAKLWQRIYEVLLFIYYYPFPEGSNDTERRGRRNPEIWSLVDAVQVNNHRGYDNRWTDGTLYEKKCFIPTYPKFEFAKNGQKLINDYYKIYNMKFDGYKTLNINNINLEYYRNNYSRLAFYEDHSAYAGDGHWAYWRQYDHIGWQSTIYPKTQAGFNAVKNHANSYTADDGRKGKIYLSYIRTVDENYNDNQTFAHWTNNENWAIWDGGENEWGYSYIYDEDYYEPLADDESYVKLTNPNKAELPRYSKYNFTNALQWAKDIDNHLVYIQHNNFVQFVSKQVAPGDDILFKMYKEILEKLDTKMPSDRKAKQTIILSEYIAQIQEIIKNYKINGDRCRACNSYCNAGGCQATWQTCGEEPCLFEKQFGGPSAGQTIVYASSFMACRVGGTDSFYYI